MRLFSTPTTRAAVVRASAVLLLAGCSQSNRVPHEGPAVPGVGAGAHPLPRIDPRAPLPRIDPGAPRDTAPLGDEMSARVAGALTTDSVSYTARPTGRAGRSAQYSFTVVARFENRGDVRVYIPRCYPNSAGPMYGVREADTAGTVGTAQERMQNRPAYDQIWACVGHDHPFEVAPGATRVDTLRLVGPTAWDGRTGEGIGRVEGRFRLGYRAGVCRRRSDLCRRPDSTWYSNGFSVRVER